MARKGVNGEQPWNQRDQFTVHRFLFTARFKLYVKRAAQSWVLEPGFSLFMSVSMQ